MSYFPLNKCSRNSLFISLSNLDGVAALIPSRGHQKFPSKLQQTPRENKKPSLHDPNQNLRLPPGENPGPARSYFAPEIRWCLYKFTYLILIDWNVRWAFLGRSLQRALVGSSPRVKDGLATRGHTWTAWVAGQNWRVAFFGNLQKRWVEIRWRVAVGGSISAGRAV